MKGLMKGKKVATQKGMKKMEEKKEHKAKREVISHLKKDNKECMSENKMHNKLIRKMKKD